MLVPRPPKGVLCAGAVVVGAADVVAAVGAAGFAKRPLLGAAGVELPPRPPNKDGLGASDVAEAVDAGGCDDGGPNEKAGFGAAVGAAVEAGAPNSGAEPDGVVAGWAG